MTPLLQGCHSNQSDGSVMWPSVKTAKFHLDTCWKLLTLNRKHQFWAAIKHNFKLVHWPTAASGHFSDVFKSRLWSSVLLLVCCCLAPPFVKGSILLDFYLPQVTSNVCLKFSLLMATGDRGRSDSNALQPAVCFSEISVSETPCSHGEVAFCAAVSLTWFLHF